MRFVPARAIVRALLPVRVTWCVMLASMLAFYALPWLTVELRRTLEANPKRPAYVYIAQVAPGELRTGAAVYAMWTVCTLCLALAVVVPRRLHAQTIARTPLFGAELVDSRGAYRAAPDRRFVVTTGSLDRLLAAYHARLGTTLLLLWPGLVIAGYYGAVPLKWFSSVMGCGVVFAGVQEYLPMVVLATIVLMASGPSPGRVLGPHARGFERGRLALLSREGHAPRAQARRP